MTTDRGPEVSGPASLRRFLTPRVQPDTGPTIERCELCAGQLAVEHPHLVDVVGRSLRCACRPCALLFIDRTREMAGTAYRTVPDRYLRDPNFTLADAQWDALQIPVGMAFFLRNSTRDDAVVACYPSPAGATESELDMSDFTEGVAAGRLGEVLEADVEALLVRHDSGHSECLLVPIDACYRLVGLVRKHWKGFDGGADAWTHINGFFDDARRRTRDVAVARNVGVRS